MTNKSFPVKWSYSTYYAFKAESNETYLLNPSFDDDKETKMQTK